MMPLGEVEHVFQGEAERKLAIEALTVTLADSVR